MTSLITFRRVVNQPNVYTLKLPDAPQGQQAAQELATLPDGRTVLVLFDGYTLPADQPAEITDSIVNPFVPTDAELAQIKNSSVHVQAIYNRTEQMIRDKYSASDEAKFARIGVGAALGAYTFAPGEQEELLAFGDHCEAARQWGRAERAKLGL